MHDDVDHGDTGLQNRMGDKGRQEEVEKPSD